MHFSLLDRQPSSRMQADFTFRYKELTVHIARRTLSLVLPEETCLELVRADFTCALDAYQLAQKYVSKNKSSFSTLVVPLFKEEKKKVTFAPWILSDDLNATSRSSVVEILMRSEVCDLAVLLDQMHLAMLAENEAQCDKGDSAGDVQCDMAMCSGIETWMRPCMKSVCVCVKKAKNYWPWQGGAKDAGGGGKADKKKAEAGGAGGKTEKKKDAAAVAGSKNGGAAAGAAVPAAGTNKKDDALAAKKPDSAKKAPAAAPHSAPAASGAAVDAIFPNKDEYSQYQALPTCLCLLPFSMAPTHTVVVCSVNLLYGDGVVA